MKPSRPFEKREGGEMVAGNEGAQIVRISQDSTAGTGEGNRYLTAAGIVWRDLTFDRPIETGEIRGVRVGDRIYEDR